MSFEVGVVGRFKALHHLVGNFGPASDPHTHEYRVEVAAFGDTLQDDGTLLDITLLEAALVRALDVLDGRDLNEVAIFAARNPSAEVVARYLFDAIAPSLSETSIERLSVRLWESDQAYAAYSEATRR